MSFETLYLIFGLYITCAGLLMIITYSLTNPWWKSHLGRMMITYAVAEVLMSLLLLIAVVWHVSPYWFRAVWFTLQAVVGSTFVFQTVVLITLHRARQREQEEAI